MKSKIIIPILISLSLIESLYIYFSPTPRIGLEALFVIPLIFAVCIYFFGNKLIEYHINGVGLKIYYLVAIIRYLIQPLLIIQTEGFLKVHMPEAKAESYHIAIVIYCIELIIACFTIQKYYPQYVNKYKRAKTSTSQLNFNIISVFIIFSYCSILLIRMGIWLPELSILGIKQSASSTKIVIDATFFNCIKAFIFVGLLALSKKHINVNYKFKLYFNLALIAAIFNFISYFGENRSFIYESAIATIAIFLHNYPKYRKKITYIIVPIALLIMYNSFVTKQFGVNSSSELSINNIELNFLSNTIEEYTNGLWTVARSYQASIGITGKASLEAFIKDISDGFSAISAIPGFGLINKLFIDLKSSASIFKESLMHSDDIGQMLSLSGGLMIIGGEIFGWIFMIIGNYLMIRLLTKMEVASKITSDLYYKYMYIWMSSLMGLIHCYCLQTIIYCWSKFILFYWLVIFVNKLVSKKTKYNNKYNIHEKTN